MPEVIAMCSKMQSPAFDWPEEAIHSIFLNAEIWGLVTPEKRLVAFAVIADRPQAWEILAFAVNPNVQKQGWGRRLLNHLFDAKGKNREWWLEVHESNLAAKKLYFSAGFKEVGRRIRYYKDGAAAVTMTKTS